MLLLLELLEGENVIAFNTASQCNLLRNLLAKFTWSRSVRSIVDMAHVRGLLNTLFWMTWLIDREVQSSSLQVIRSSVGPVTDASLKVVHLPDLTNSAIDGDAQMTDVAVRLIAAG